MIPATQSTTLPTKNVAHGNGANKKNSGNDLPSSLVNGGKPLSTSPQVPISSKRRHNDEIQSQPSLSTFTSKKKPRKDSPTSDNRQSPEEETSPEEDEKDEEKSYQQNGIIVNCSGFNITFIT